MKKPKGMTYTLGTKFHLNIPVVAVVVGVALSIITSAFSYYAEKKVMQAEFNEDVENLYSALKREIDVNIAVLASLQALYYISGKDVDRSEFRNYTNHLLKQHASIQALEWIPRVPDFQRKAYERAARKDGFPDFQFTENIVQGKMKRAEKQKEYFPVYFIEPYKGNEIALGFNLGSSPSPLEALEVARKTGEIRATGRIILVQETKNQFGFIVFAPVYRKGALINSEQSRWDNLEGFTSSAFRISDIAEKATNYIQPENIDFFIYDTSASEKERFLYTHSSRTRKTPLLTEDHPETNIINSKTLEVGGRKWMIIYSATPNYIAANSSWHPWGILLSGLTITGLITGFLFVSGKHNEHVEKLAKDLSDINTNLKHEIMARDEAEEELRESEERYHALFQQSPDGVLLINTAGKIIEFNDTASRQLGYSLEEFAKLSMSDIDVVLSLEELQAMIGKVLERGQAEFESKHRTKQGEVRDVNILMKVIVLSGRPFFHSIWRDMTEHKEYEKELRNSREQMRHLASYLQTIRERERTVIAREIHDELGQSLTALKFDLMNLTRDINRLEGRERSAICDKMHLISGFIDELSEKVHKIAMELRPGILDHLGLTSAIEWQLLDFQKRTGISAEYTPAVKAVVNREIATAIFRILQEALTNIIRHANATRVEVILKEEAGHLNLVIEDNGEGFSENNLKDEYSLGLLGMKERASSHGGTLDITSTIGAGTKVVVSVPNKEEQL